MTPTRLYSAPLFRPVIEREIFSVSVPLPVRRALSRVYRPCAAGLRCGIPLSDYRLSLSPHPPPSAAPLPLHIPTQSMCFKQTGNGNIPLHTCTHTYSFLLCSGPCRTRVGVELMYTMCYTLSHTLLGSRHLPKPVLS